MSLPLVSILIPAYNAQAWIAATIESALQQTWQHKEIIVVDDGSRDETARVARQFCGQGVQVVVQPNQGAAAARNKAFEMSKGDFIQWLDADDLLSKEKVACQMAVALQLPTRRYLLSGGWGYFMYRPCKARFDASPLWADLPPMEWLLRKWENNAHMQTATWLVSRELSQSIGPWDPEMFVDDDGEYFFRAVLASDGIRFCPEAKVFYRVSGTSGVSSIGRSDRKKNAQLRGMRLQIQKLRAVDDGPRARAACLTYLQTWFHYFYPDRPDLVEQAQELATDLGGKLRAPRLRWKYAWLEPLFGYRFAKAVQAFLPELRWRATRTWDRTLYTMSSHKGALG